MPRIDQNEIDDLKSRTKLSKLFEDYGVRSKGGDTARWANCCFHGEKSPSLKINDRDGRYHCFGCGASGDHFSVMAELGGKTFFEAVEALGGVKPILTVEERQALNDKREQQKKRDEEKQQRDHSAVERIFDSAKPIMGTHAAAYLEARGLKVGKSWTFDLRFVADLTYRGYADGESNETVDLGPYPAMVAAIRNVRDQIIGLHRTYLDRGEPKKLVPPGDAKRNRAKKILGEQRGGMIKLSPPAAVLAMGEGIETSRAWFALGLTDQDVAVAAAVSLGNLSGGSLGTIEHPEDPQKRIPNGKPDLDRPGVVLPDGVKEVIELGDSDSEPYMTRARLLVAGRRFREQGRVVSIAMAPDGMDFNDLLMAEGT